jgi:hypothetical protein
MSMRYWRRERMLMQVGEPQHAPAAQGGASRDAPFAHHAGCADTDGGSLGP